MAVALISALLVLAVVLPALLPNDTAPPQRQMLAEDFDLEEHHSQTPGDGRIPKAPNPAFFSERAYPFGRIERKDWERAQLQARALRQEASLMAGAWEALGPTNIGGRITDIAVDPTDHSIVYVGAAEGGVLRTTDGGASWTCLFDDQATLSIGALAIDPNHLSMVYAGTGEVNPGGGSVAYGGAGIFRSLDQGNSWTCLGLEETGSIGRICIDPADPARIFVAAMGRLWESGPHRGIYRSTDYGATWEKVLFVSDSTGCVDLVMRPDEPEVLFAAMWERMRRPDHYQYGGATCGVYKSTDGGDTWTPVGGGLPPPSAGIGRIGLSLCESQPDVMHAVYADNIGYFYGLFRSIDGGASWAQTNDGALASVFASYGWWFGNVRTHPQDPEIIYVLGLDFWRSTDGGASYHDATDEMHVDHHGLDFSSGPNPVIYEGNDGGVYVSINGGSEWTKLYHLPITQVYRVALDAGNPEALYGGAQDNGTVRTLTGAADDWTMVFGGDGFQPLIHPTDPDQIWAQFQYGNIYYSDDGGTSWNYATYGINGGDRNNWNSPLIQDPTDPDRRYFGTHRVYRSTSATAWTPISPDLTGGSHGGHSGQVDGTLTTMAVSPVDGDVIWTGSDDGYVYVSANGGSNWTMVSGDLPERWITSVKPDPHWRETAYVTISGFRWAEPLPHVFKTTDLGDTWTAIAGNLPEAPANDFIADRDIPGRYFVATDVGVFETHDGGTHWSMLGTNLPNVVVTSLALRESDRMLIAGTYGRSFFGYDVGDASAVRPPDEVGLPALGRTLPPHPNPAKAGTWIAWELSRKVPVEIEIYTVSGRLVWSKTVRDAASGAGGVMWDASDSRGRKLPPGAYFVRLKAGGEILGQETLILVQ